MDLTADTRAKVVRENVAAVYGMQVPEPMPREDAPDMEAVWGTRDWIQR